MLVLLAHAIEDSTDIFGISGGGVDPPLGTPLLECKAMYRAICFRYNFEQFS